jgi:hypothetical protein
MTTKAVFCRGMIAGWRLAVVTRWLIEVASIGANVFARKAGFGRGILPLAAVALRGSPGDIRLES